MLRKDVKNSNKVISSLRLPPHKLYRGIRACNSASGAEQLTAVETLGRWAWITSGEFEEFSYSFEHKTGYDDLPMPLLHFKQRY